MYVYVKIYTLDLHIHFFFRYAQIVLPATDFLENFSAFTYFFRFIVSFISFKSLQCTYVCVGVRKINSIGSNSKKPLTGSENGTCLKIERNSVSFSSDHLNWKWLFLLLLVGKKPRVRLAACWLTLPRVELQIHYSIEMSQLYQADTTEINITRNTYWT